MIPLKDSQSTNTIPIWVFAFITLNLVIFFMQFTSPSNLEFINKYALIPNLVDFSKLSTLYPFITSQFLHGGILHLLSNMWFLWIFGDNVEEKFGRIFFPLVYIFSGIAGAFAQYLFMPNSAIPMIGASGAIAGILGAYFAWFPHHTIKSLVGIPFFGFGLFDIPASIMLFYWLVTQFLSGVGNLIPGQDIGGVAYFAHIGGFLAGYIIAKLWPRHAWLQ